MLKIYTFDEFDDGEFVTYSKEKGIFIKETSGFLGLGKKTVIKLESGRVVERPSYRCFYNKEDRNRELSELCDDELY